MATKKGNSASFKSPSAQIEPDRPPHFSPPLDVPTHGPGGAFAIACSTTIVAPPTTCLDVLLNAPQYDDWNRFCRHITITAEGRWPDDAGSPASPEGLQSIKTGVGYLAPGAQFIMDLDMECGEGQTPAKISQQPLEVTTVDPLYGDGCDGEEDDGEGHRAGPERRFRGYRVAWKMLGTPHWLLHSERVQELFVADDNTQGGNGGMGTMTDYRCWETFGGLIGWLVWWTNGGKVMRGFATWMQGLKDAAEKESQLAATRAMA